MINHFLKKEIVESIREHLIDTGETVSAGESVTSGLIQIVFSEIPDAQKFFQGGITTYNIGQKYRHLNIEPIHAVGCNCVSPKVAREMAENICAFFHSHWGLGITGYATPSKDSNEKLFAHYSIAYNGCEVLGSTLQLSKEDVENAKEKYAAAILADFQKCLEDRKWFLKKA